MALEDDLSIEFQFADVSSIIGVYVVQILCVSEPTIECEVSRNLILDHQIDQISEQDVVVLEHKVTLFISLTLNEPTKLDWVVLATCADMIHNEVVVSDLVAFVGVVPKYPTSSMRFP